MADDYADALLEQSALNSAFNAQQAQLNRDWQEYMSGTSHQREVGDLIAAGLNPVLSANSGSSWSSVANGSADPSSAQGLANLAATFMNNQASIEISKINAEATKAAAGATAAAMLGAAATSAEATRYASDQSYKSNLVSARASQRNTHVGATTTQRGQDINALIGGGIPGLINSAKNAAF